MKRLTKQEEKYAAELEDALKQFSELRDQAKNVDLAELLEQRAALQSDKNQAAASKIKTAYGEKFDLLGKAVIINGGDTYVAEYKERYGTIDQIMTGVNQESVWSGIDFDKGTFYEQTKETRDYFCEYLEVCKADGMEVYLLEYTTDQNLIQKIEEYCKERGSHFYISSFLELR